MSVWVVAGPAGAGKSTLGRALAELLGAVLLDLDTLTNPLLDGLAPALGLDPHWNSPVWRPAVRPARYAALLAVARETVGLGHDVVLVAPFTAELAGGVEWELLTTAVSPVLPRVVWLRATPDLLTARVARRGEPRDAVVETAVLAEPVEPAVPHLAVAAALPTSAQLERALGHGLGHGPGHGPGQPPAR